MAISKLPTGAILDNSITNAKIADDAIGVADLAATGTPSTTTFLRGDNAWAVPIGGVTSVNGVTGAITAAHIATAVEAASGSNTFTDADHTKLSNIEGSATADQTNSEIKTAVEAATSIALGGSPTTTTQAESDNTTKLATTAYVTAKITTLIGGAPSTLNDLNELALAINDDANYNSTLTTALATKLPLAGGAMTGTITNLRSTGIDDNADALAMTITSSENVGIGTTSPAELLHVESATNSTKIRIKNTKSGTTTGAELEMVNEDGGWQLGTGRGSLHAGEDTDFHIYGNGTRMWIKRSNGSAYFANNIHAGDGISFNGETDAAHLLDDYEEGTATMRFKAAGHGTLAGSSSVKYTKIGRLVTISGDMSGSISGLVQNANMEIQGLPFTTVGVGTFVFFTRNFQATGSDTINVIGYYPTNNTHLQVWTMPNHANYIQAKVQDFHASTNDCYFTVTYSVS